MQLRVLPVVLVVLVALACSQAPQGPQITMDPCVPIVLVPADDVTAAERASIEDALRLWNDAAGTELTLGEVEGAAHVPVHFRDAPLIFLGVYERGSVVVNRGLTDERTRTVVLAHELGHAFGLAHVEDEGSVMVPGNATVAPGPRDAAAIAALWGACR